MCAFNKFFVFLYSVSVVFLTTKMNVLAEKNLPSIFTDDAFVNDDICSSVINQHPCVKNILQVLVQEINLLKTSSSENLQKVDVLQEHQEKLKREVKEHQEKHKRELSQSKREIKFLKTQLKTLQLEEQTEPDTVESTVQKENQRQYDNYINTFFENLTKLSWPDMNNMKNEVDNTTINFMGHHRETIAQKRNQSLGKRYKWYESPWWDSMGRLFQLPKINSIIESYQAAEQKGSSRRLPRSTFPYDYQKYQGVEEIYYPESVEENAPQYQNRYYAPNKESNWINNNRKPLATINWRRMGHAIDRQFGLAGGFFSAISGLVSNTGVLSALPVLTTVATGVNSIGTYNQQLRIDAQQNDVDSIKSSISTSSTDLTSLTARVAALEAQPAGSSTADADIADLKTKMVETGTSLKSFGDILDFLGASASTIYDCCCNTDNHKTRCVQRIFSMGSVTAGTDGECGPPTDSLCS